MAQLGTTTSQSCCFLRFLELLLAYSGNLGGDFSSRGGMSDIKTVAAEAKPGWGKEACSGCLSGSWSSPESWSESEDELESESEELSSESELAGVHSLISPMPLSTTHPLV